MKDETKKKGRRKALELLRNEMRGMEAEGMKKVSVMAKDDEGLKEGLDVAKSKVDEMSEMTDEMAEEHIESHEASNDEEDEYSDMSKEDLIKKLKETME